MCERESECVRVRVCERETVSVRMCAACVCVYDVCSDTPQKQERLKT